MRSIRADFRRRAKGRVDYRMCRQEVTSHADLELVREYLKGRRFPALMRRAAGKGFPYTDLVVVPMLLTLLGLILIGGRRVWHLGYELSDPALKRFSGLARMPSSRTVSAWLQRITAEDVERLRRLNSELVAEELKCSGRRRLTLDVGGSVVSTGLQVEGARRGFNPHQRKVPSYYPITAYEAQSGHIVRVENRPGNIHDGKAGLGFIAALIKQMKGTVGRLCRLELRMDAVFSRRDVLELLGRDGAEYAIKVPFHPWVASEAGGDAGPLAEDRRRWKRTRRCGRSFAGTTARAIGSTWRSWRGSRALQRRHARISRDSTGSGPGWVERGVGASW